MAAPEKASGEGRFDYVRYDAKAQAAQDKLKVLAIQMESAIEETLDHTRERSLALTHLEETYVWIGKAIKVEQVKRNGSAPLQEERGDNK